MQPQPNKLWRKIGLQKNFLEGTSHSDFSELSINQSIQCSPFISKKQSHLEETGWLEKNYHKIKEHHFKLIKMPHQSKNFQLMPGNTDKADDIVESPISKLDFTDFDNECKEWHKKMGDRLNNKNLVDWNVERLLETGKSVNQQVHQSAQYQESSSHYKQSDFEQSIKKSICVNSVTSVEQKHPTQYGSQFLSPRKQQPLHALHSFQEKSIDCQMINSRESVLEQAFFSQLIKRQSVQSEVIEVVEYFDVMKQGRQYRGLGSQINAVKNTMPRVINMIHELRLVHKQSQLQMRKQLEGVRQKLSHMVNDQIRQKLTQYQYKVSQLNEQLSYLYLQNKQLMQKLTEKQQFIKKTSDQVQKMAQTLSSIQRAKLTSESSQVDKQKDQLIERQLNQINRLYERMEDWEQLENANELLKQNIHQLEEQITSAAHLEWTLNNQLVSLEAKHQETHHQLIKAEVQLTAKDNTISELKLKHQDIVQQLNQTYAKLDQLHFQLNGEYNQQLEAQQQQFILQLNQQKKKFHTQLQNTQQNNLQTTKHYQSIIKQIAKTINQPQLQIILNKLNLHKNHPTVQLLISNQSKPLQQQLNYNFKHNERLNTQNSQQKNPIQDSSHLGTPIESDQEHSPSKNLQKTGFFGQASHANIQTCQPHDLLNPYDVAKRYSTQRSQFNEELAHYKNMYQTLTYKNQNNSKSKSKSPSEISEKSFSSLFKEQQTFKTKLSNFYSNLNNSSGWSPKRQSSEIFPYTQTLSLKNSKVLKVSRTKKEYLTSNDGHDISFTNSQHHYFEDPVKETTDEKPQFKISQLSSPTNYVPFETSYASTTYFKSQKYSPENKPSNCLPYKPYVQKNRDQVDDMVDKIKQKINQKLKSQTRQSPTHSHSFKPTSFKQTVMSSRDAPSIIKNHVNLGITTNRPVFQKQSKNYSFGYSTIINPFKTGIAHVQQNKSRSKSQNKLRLKSPSLESTPIYPFITPRGQGSHFQKTSQLHPKSFTKINNFQEYNRMSPSPKHSKKQPIINKYQVRISPHKSSHFQQNQRESFKFGRY